MNKQFDVNEFPKKVAVVSDVHGNLQALEVVLAEIKDGGFDEIWHTGDIVGYGARPNEVVKLLKRAGAKGISGNHDAEAIDAYSNAPNFNPAARAAILWTKKMLDVESLDWLSDLRPLNLLGIGNERVLLTHGSPRSPHSEYMSPINAGDAFKALEDFGASFGLFGHTHVPVEIFKRLPKSQPYSAYEEVLFMATQYAENYLTPLMLPTAAIGAWINSGSVGQPRDGDSRASWLSLEVAPSGIAHRQIHRAEYDIEGAKRDILQAGLPESLASRLGFGA
ncbi:COG0622 Predicted phosphoesterase [uncultured Caudovirales phage]|uniref:COG0622 Predicted phosphoesterase n=1 Tax=uncultured Caudovirales phage TaxID=2100421 RepID=A0A6J5RXS2_9CAUD|nr:COG0622 Predicted phosphoesterase [uncultured Caudovirales phage]